MMENASINDIIHSSDHNHELPDVHEMDYTFYLWYLQPILGLVIVFGNGLTIAAVRRFTALHSAPNILIANLAFADLLIVPLTMPMQGMFLYFHIEIENCYIPLCLSCIPLLSSLLFLVVIALERTLCITKPFVYKKHATIKNSIFASIATWFVSVVLSFWQVVNPNVTAKGKCGPNRVLTAEFSLMIAVVFACIAVALACLYGAISWIARKQSRRIAFETRCQEINKKSDAKVRRMMMAVLGVFYFCWTPHIIIIVSVHYLHYHPQWVMLLRECTELLAFTNFMVNPIIYTVCNKYYSVAFKSLIGIRNTKKTTQTIRVVESISVIDTCTFVQWCHLKTWVIVIPLKMTAVLLAP